MSGTSPPTSRPSSGKPSSIHSKESIAPPPQSLGRTSPILSYFCVYNPSLGPTEETNKDQILYYTAKRTVPLDVKMRQVGLAQALVNFTTVFSPTRPAQTVHSQKNRMVFLEPEPGFWVHMCVELGVSRRQIKDATTGKLKTITEYLDAELNDRALESVLEVGYRMYRLLNGTFTSMLHSHLTLTNPLLVTRQSTRRLMHAIEEFFADWIWRWDFDRLESMMFATVFDGVPFHPVTRGTYLHIQRAGEMLAAKLDGLVAHMLVLGKEDGGLVWHSPGLVMRDVRSLRKYVGKMVEKDAEREREEEKKRAAAKARKDGEKVSGIKAITKTWSHTSLLGYFSGTPSTSTSTSILGSKRAPSPTPSPSISTPSSPEPKSSLLAAPSSEAALAPLMPNGRFLTGLVETAPLVEGGVKGTKIDLVKVYLSNGHIVEVMREEKVLEKGEKQAEEGGETDGEGGGEAHGKGMEEQQQQQEEEEEEEEEEEKEEDIVEEEDVVEEDDVDRSEFYLIIYKHKSNLTWTFLLPTSNDAVAEKVIDLQFYRDLERFMVEHRMDDTVRMVEADGEKGKKVGTDADKEYRYLYFNNLTLAIKCTIVNGSSRSSLLSTIASPRPSATLAAPSAGAGTAATATVGAGQSLVVTNEMLQQVLDLKEDFERLPDLNEIYTRSTSNYWVVGHRVASVKAPKSGNGNAAQQDLGEGEDTRELYMVAAKKDSTLVDVEDDMRKLSAFISSGVFLE